MTRKTRIQMIKVTMKMIRKDQNLKGNNLKNTNNKARVIEKMMIKRRRIISNKSMINSLTKKMTKRTSN